MIFLLHAEIFLGEFLPPAWPKVALIGLLYKRVILSHKAAERLGEKMDDQAIGTGPYRFVGWQRGVHFTMRRNDKYWDKAPNIREIVWRPIKEDADRVAAIESGQAEVHALRKDLVWKPRPDEKIPLANARYQS